MESIEMSCNFFGVLFFVLMGFSEDAAVVIRS